MDERLSDLLGVIKEEINLYRDIIEHARENTSLLARGRVEAIQESNKVAETFHIKLRFLENELKRLLSEICRISGIACEDITLAGLAGQLQEPAATELKSQTERFRNVVTQLKSVSRLNLQLIEQSLKYSRGLLGLVSNATSSYQPTGLFRPIPSVQPTFSHKA
ncbi:MAG: flagellar export chaperone FlgN [Acidobacteria bacterium]|nr:flagellar export chaperone FlgN [Acidobacteriota bacterium]